MSNNTNTTSTTTVTAVEYRPTKRTVKILKGGARKTRESSFYIRIRTSRGWQELCTIVRDKSDWLYKFTGTMCQDKARVSIAKVMELFGIEIPPAVAEAAKEAERRLAKKTVKRLENVITFIDAGVDAARAAAAEKAGDKWARMDVVRENYEKALVIARSRAVADD